MCALIISLAPPSSLSPPPSLPSPPLPLLTRRKVLRACEPSWWGCRVCLLQLSPHPLMVVRRMALLLTQEQIPLLPTVLQSLIAVWCALCRALNTSCRLPLRPLDPSCLQWHASLLTRRRALSLPRCLRCVGVGTTVAVPGAAQGMFPPLHPHIPLALFGLRLALLRLCLARRHLLRHGLPRMTWFFRGLLRPPLHRRTACLLTRLPAIGALGAAPPTQLPCPISSSQPLLGSGLVLWPSVLLMPATVMRLSMLCRAPRGCGFCTCAVCAHVHAALP